MICQKFPILLALVTGCLSYAVPTRPKRQLFRDEIPHHRPLTGATYHHHAGFPHPSRWHENAGEVVPPNPNAPPTPAPELKPGDIPDPPKPPQDDDNNHLFGPSPLGLSHLSGAPSHFGPPSSAPGHFGPPSGPHGHFGPPSGPHMDLSGFIELGHNELRSPSNVSPGLSYSWITRHRR